ncbi:ATP-dependent helicase C-terminal domain-containing protein [Reinekea marinisedimentorum]|nr:ATP-dependent helicase C-terminal domain-containing protein [Reinekea marinisedimentorum]
MQLPIDDIKQPVLQAWQSGGCIVSAPPGSGKTTKLPLWLLEQSDQTIYLLIPKRLAVMLAAKQLAANLGESVGQRVGYRLRHEARVGESTRLIVTTYGSFIRMVLNDTSLLESSTVILDEFHERSVDQDFCYALINEYAEVLDDSVRRVVMSATFNSRKIEEQTGLPRVESDGFSHPLSVSYQKASKDWVSDAAQVARQLHAESDNHVLVFLPGLREIRALGSRLASDIPTLILHGQLDKTPDIQSLERAEPTLILATNIAESSLTLPRVSTVLDCGYERCVNTDATTGINQLRTRKISKASATQRAGRAARLGPGKAYRLWSEAEHERLIDHQPPEIEQADLSEHYLLALRWGSPPAELPWPDKPGQHRLTAAQNKLLQWRAIDENNRLTEHGTAMLNTGLSPWIAHLLVCCANHAVAEAGLYLAAHLSLNKPVDYDPVHTSTAHAFSSAVKKEAEKLAARLGYRLGSNFSPLSETALVSALPDRLIFWQNDKGQLFNGTQCSSRQSLKPGSWMIFLEGIQQGSTIVLNEWISVSEAAVLQATAPQTMTEFVTTGQQPYFRKIQKIGDIKISEQRCTPDSAEKTSAWLKHIANQGEKALQWPEQATQLKQRWLFAREHDSSWPAWPDEQQLSAIAEPYLGSLSTLNKLNIYEAMLQTLSYEQQQSLAHCCPESWQAPSGRTVAVHYDFSNGNISAQCKLQEAFGLRELPTICGQSLSLELTAPNGRPVAKVTDLKHFWDTVYPQVRKELRGRYAKHPWPEDPLNFQATTKTNRQIRVHQ